MKNVELYDEPMAAMAFYWAAMGNSKAVRQVLSEEEIKQWHDNGTITTNEALSLRAALAAALEGS